MPLVFITGNSGVGKTTLTNALASRGFEAHDMDEISSFHNNRTGQRVDRPSKVVDRTKAWYASHTWKTPRPKVEALAKRGEVKTVILLGGTQNEQEIWDLFNRVLYLDIPEEELLKRVLERTQNDYGQAPAEMSRIKSWHKEIDEHYRKLGATFIDARGSVQRVVDRILDQVRESDT